MATNRGVAPPDMTTEVGRLRAILGDLSYAPLDPVEPGFGDYTLFSDEELGAFLATGGSIEGAASLAYLQLAAGAAMESKSVKDQDLQVDLTKRATDLRLIAAVWADKAAAQSADIFEMVDVSIRDEYCEPELAARRVCGGIRFF